EAGDADLGVVLQLGYSLRQHWRESEAHKLLGVMATEHGRDPYVLAGILSSVTDYNWAAFAREILDRHRGRVLPPHLAAPLLRLAPILGKNGPNLVEMFFLAASSDVGASRIEQFVGVSQLLEALESQKSSLALLRREAKGDGDQKAWSRIEGLYAAARKIVADPQAPPAEKIAALPLLGRGTEGHEQDRQLLLSQLAPQIADDVQAVAVTCLARQRQRSMSDEFLKRWKSYGPGLRSHVLDTLLSEKDGTALVLAALERKHVLPFEIDAARRQRLLEHKDPSIRARATKLLAGSVDPDRRKVGESTRPALKHAGDAARGAKVFAKNCAACHKPGDVGQQVGPDLASVGDKSPEGLLTAILDPNQAVEARYIGYTAVTKNGLT